MVQGTGSHVGKSVVTAALCRIFKEMGLMVAPFKSQNMALNSFVTPDGGEIGRAQAFQAEAAGIEPTVDMNPILLKPSGDSVSQVIVRGRVFRSMSAVEYHAFKREALSIALESFNRLANEHDVVVIEGAGSPAEINLRENDVANMGLAEAIGAPVVLVADIDRGGVFASLVGTLELLSQSERELVAGFIVNKFRGDRRLLDPGIEMLEERTKKPVLGVLPYMAGALLSDEDSVSLDSHKAGQGDLKIAVIRFPRISNFTDFDALRSTPGVELRYATNRGDAAFVAKAALVILPGSKNVAEDLKWLKATGLAEVVMKYRASGGAIIGICGGFQMLGSRISDPHGVEGAPGNVESGLGLIDAETVLMPEKRTYRVTAEVIGEGARPFNVSGYEIHMGETCAKERPFSRIVNRNLAPVDIQDGAVSSDGLVMGTYVHGVFDNDELRWAILERVAKKAGLKAEFARVGFTQTRMGAFDEFVESVRRNVDMERILRIARTWHSR
jgi:adenosylcobyric acid synthase